MHIIVCRALVWFFSLLQCRVPSNTLMPPY